MDEISFRGGSHVGWVNVGLPLAKLTCSRERLTLSSLGTCEFTPEQVVSFGTYGSIPLLANGLSIEHNRLDYPRRVVFWCVGSRDRVLEEIRQIGFVPRGVAVERPRGMPFRWSFIIAFVLLWNLGFVLSNGTILPARDAPMFPGPVPVSGFALAFVLATAIKLSSRVQRLVLAPGHAVAEVRNILSLVQFISAPLAICFGVIWFVGTR
jgi:hypothetical protein